MISWTIVEAVYVIDVLIFGYLFYYFATALKGTEGNSRIVIRTMAILTGVLFLHELYFGTNTLTDPNKLGVASHLFPAINSVWLYAKLIITAGGLSIIYSLLKMEKKE